ncbi:hypothetical protein MUN77_15445 [Leucobacter allii]|uniref:hypothetical protein n=1 Tax=Leucobacter allii TaxID=2932247 RepID=UPI001FD19B34|nr:hypothetical protein [Leucobacter allii]UOR01502.1 hypothetical protein MUN77_15445 [Leucobacter allii]
MRAREAQAASGVRALLTGVRLPFVAVARQGSSLTAITALAVATSGVVHLSVGAAFWGLLSGSGVFLAPAPRRERAPKLGDRREATVTS